MRSRSSSSPSPVTALVSTPSGWRKLSSRRRSPSSMSALLRTSRRGRSPAAISSSTSSTARSISSISSSGTLASTMCSSRSARRVSSSVAPNASTSWCGSFLMKPTVSVSRKRRPAISVVRVVGSRVWKRRSRTPTAAPVRAVGVVGEDVEDDRRAVDDRDRVERLLEVALLARAELVVAGDDVGVGALDRHLELVELARAEVAVRVRVLAMLDHLADGGDARGTQELLELGEVVAVGEGRDHQGTLTSPSGTGAVGRGGLGHAAAARALHRHPV